MLHWQIWEKTHILPLISDLSHGTSRRGNVSTVAQQWRTPDPDPWQADTRCVPPSAAEPPKRG